VNSPASPSGDETEFRNTPIQALQESRRLHTVECKLNLPKEAAEFPTAECRAKQPRRDQGGDDESESTPDARL
jgi:hypothetical protein